jgi:hypothetical protein
MTFLQKTTQAVAVLFVLFLSTILILPPGMDLELCFGKDGHVDFSLIGCPDSSLPNRASKERSPVYDTAHHDDYFHVAVACSMAQELIRTDGKSDSYKSEPNKDPSKTPLIFSELLAGSAGAYLDSNGYPIPYDDFPSPGLVSLRTVVLLF